MHACRHHGSHALFSVLFAILVENACCFGLGISLIHMTLKMG